MHQAFSAPVKAETSAPQRQIDRTNHLHKNEDTHHGPTARAPRSRYAPGAPKPSQENTPKKPTSSTTKTTNVSLAVRSLTLCELLDRAEQENGVRRARPFQLPTLNTCRISRFTSPNRFELEARKARTRRARSGEEKRVGSLRRRRNKPRFTA